MNKDTVNQVLDALAARLAVPVAHLWAVLTRQLYVEFWRETIEMAFVALVLVLPALLLVRWLVRERPEFDDYMLVYVGAGALCIVSLFAFFIQGSAFVHVATQLANPEYYALHEVLGAFK